MWEGWDDKDWPSLGGPCPVIAPQVREEVVRPGGVAASYNLIQLPPWLMLENAQRAITPKSLRRYH